MPIRSAPVLVLLLAGVVSGCTIEHRPDVEPDDEGGSGTGPAGRAASAEDSARAVVAAFREALALGDGARVAALTVPGALLVDQEEGVRWRRSTASGEALPAPLGSAQGGLAWSVSASEYARLGDAGGLLVTRYVAEVAGEEVPWSAVESFVLVRTPDGWRVRYLHRSRGRQDSGRGP